MTPGAASLACLIAPTCTFVQGPPERDRLGGLLRQRSHQSAQHPGSYRPRPPMRRACPRFMRLLSRFERMQVMNESQYLVNILTFFNTVRRFTVAHAVPPRLRSQSQWPPVLVLCLSSVAAATAPCLCALFMAESPARVLPLTLLCTATCSISDLCTSLDLSVAICVCRTHRRARATCTRSSCSGAKRARPRTRRRASSFSCPSRSTRGR